LLSRSIGTPEARVHVVDPGFRVGVRCIEDPTYS